MPAQVKCALGKMRIEDVAARLGKSPTANGVNRDAPATGSAARNKCRTSLPCLSQLRAGGMLQR